MREEDSLVIDAEKVKKGLECCMTPETCDIECPYMTEFYGYSCNQAVCGDALELIREMEQQLKERPKIVLCKECKHSSKSLSPFQEFGRWCNKHDRYVNSDFYCGDGKEKEDG